MTALEFLKNNYKNTDKDVNVCKFCLEFQALGVCSSVLCEQKNNIRLGERDNEKICRVSMC